MNRSEPCVSEADAIKSIVSQSATRLRQGRNEFDESQHLRLMLIDCAISETGARDASPGDMAKVIAFLIGMIVSLVIELAKALNAQQK